MLRLYTVWWQSRDRETQKEARPVWARLRGSDGTGLLHWGQRSQWGSWQHKPQYILVSVFIRVLHKRSLYYVSGVNALQGGSLKRSYESLSSYVIVWIMDLELEWGEGNLPCSAVSHWNALPMEFWNFLYMRTLRTGKAIIPQGGRRFQPQGKGHTEGLWADLLVLGVQSLRFRLYNWSQIRCRTPPAAPSPHPIFPSLL